MFALLIQSADELYAIDAKHVVEVLPLIRWRTISRVPEGIAGVINYHGTPVPVLDLAEFISRRSSERRMSTRIAIVHYADRLLGIIVDRAIETLSIDEADFVASGIATPDAPYLGKVASTAKGVIQSFDPQKIFPPDVKDHLFPVMEENASNGN